MSVLPTADEIALAIVQACWECDENPLAVMAGEPGTARIYAFVAIKDLFPLVRAPHLAGWFGAKTPATLVGQGVTGLRARWWDAKLLVRVKAAVADGVTCKPTASVARRPASSRTVPSSSQHSFGDPGAGRSALSQGYAPGSRLARERA